jgi:hypothetical protein
VAYHLTVISKLSSSLNRRDETPNLELAQHIVDTGDSSAIRELVDNLGNKDRNVRSDCIKVLYEIGERNPALITGYERAFSLLLEDKDNRLVWGGMTALDSIALESPGALYDLLPKIIAAANEGSVITRDHAVGILTKLTSLSRYSDRVVPLLFEQLRNSPVNQLPMYAERCSDSIPDKYKTLFVETLRSRLKSVEKASGRKRIEKVIRSAER